ncbi:ATP-binding protein [Enterococcus sp. S181_ASV_20]|nr:ATP-binding protein [Enterococcus sp. S181_ASV_20]
MDNPLSCTRFFCTKAKLQDHGIGLQSVRSIVESYNGTLNIDYDEKQFSNQQHLKKRSDLA